MNQDDSNQMSRKGLFLYLNVEQVFCGLSLSYAIVVSSRSLSEGKQSWQQNGETRLFFIEDT